MKNFFATLDTVITIAAVLLLVFLFKGDPDVWDTLRARAIESVGSKECKPASAAKGAPS